MLRFIDSLPSGTWWTSSPSWKSIWSSGYVYSKDTARGFGNWGRVTPFARVRCQMIAGSFAGSHAQKKEAEARSFTFSLPSPPPFILTHQALFVVLTGDFTHTPRPHPQGSWGNGMKGCYCHLVSGGQGCFWLSWKAQDIAAPLPRSSLPHPTRELCSSKDP